jgi:hypothetical protein
MNPITKLILSQLNSDVKDIEPFTGIVFKDCGACQSCVHVFKTMQEDPCWDCIEHNYDAYEER